MKKNWDYKTEIALQHHEVAAKINKRTGEIETIESRKKRNPDVEKHDQDLIFKKFYTDAWELLRSQTTDKEFLVAHKLAMKAEAYTNSLRPLRSNMTAQVIAEELGENRRNIMKYIDKLFSLGVIAKFEIAELGTTSPLTQINKYWIFNPYLSFNGKVVHSDIAGLFKNTIYGKMNK